MIERFIHDRLSPIHRSQFVQQLKIDPTLAASLSRQRQVHRLVRAYHQRELRLTLEDIFQKLYQEKPGFRKKIKSIFAP